MLDVGSRFQILIRTLTFGHVHLQQDHPKDVSNAANSYTINRCSHCTIESVAKSRIDLSLNLPEGEYHLLNLEEDASGVFEAWNILMWTNRVGHESYKISISHIC